MAISTTGHFFDNTINNQLNMCYSISSNIWRFKVIKEVEEKLKNMGYDVKLSKEDMLAVTLLGETTDKKQIERILELMSVSTIQEGKFTK